MSMTEKGSKKGLNKLVDLICRTEKRCQEKDCLKCDYSQFGEKCYPMMLARAMRQSGVRFKEEIEQQAAGK